MEKIPHLKYVSQADEVFYLYEDNIYKLNSDFKYELGEVYEDNGNICVKTAEYIYIYKNDNLIDTINTYNLNINLDDESGKMIVTSKNIYQVLSVLEDYCALSHINKNRMIISAAQTVKRE